MPSFSTFLARKYFFALGKLGAIRLMSLAALIGLALGTAAMTIVLGAFDGLETLIAEQYRLTNAPLKATPRQGHSLLLSPKDSTYLSALQNQYPDLKILPVWEKRMLLTQGEHQHICTVLGVTPGYHEAHQLSTHLLSQSDPSLDLGNITIEIGSGVAYHLGLSSVNPPPVLTAYLPRINKNTNALNLSEALAAKNVFTTSIFTLQPDFDLHHAIAPASWVQAFTQQTQPSFLEFHTTEPEKLRNLLLSHFKDRLLFANVLEQEATLIKVMRSERLVVLAILTFVVFLASFGVVSALTIIALEKKHDMFTLQSMGASRRQRQLIFFKNGVLIVASGWASGISIGVLLIVLQQYVGIIPLGSGYVQEYYPVSLSASHLVFTSAVVLSIGTAISAWTIRKIT